MATGKVKRILRTVTVKDRCSLWMATGFSFLDSAVSVTPRTRNASYLHYRDDAPLPVKTTTPVAGLFLTCHRQSNE